MKIDPKVIRWFRSLALLTIGEVIGQFIGLPDKLFGFPPGPIIFVGLCLLALLVELIWK